MISSLADAIRDGIGGALWRHRSFRRLTCVSAALCLAAASFAAGAAEPRPPYVPANDSIVLQRLPSTSDPRVRRFAALKQRTAAKPGNLAAALALAGAYLDYGRDTGDARYLGRAQAVVAPFLSQRQAPVAVLLVQADILQSRHQFAESRSVLQSILRRDPQNAQAWLTLSAVALVQGDVTEAQRACAQLLGGSNPLIAAGCIASRAMVTGNAQAALDILQRLSPQETSQSPVIQSWVHGLMADAARILGQATRADAEFKTALQLTPGDNFLIANYADFLLDQGRAREALALTRPYPQSDTSFLRQVLAESALGLPEAAADTATMASRFRDLELRGDSRLYAREEARFALELQQDPQRALRLAQENWKFQRAPEDARIFLQTALAANQPAAARPVLAYLATTQLEEPIVRALMAQVSSRLAASAVAGTAR